MALHSVSESARLTGKARQTIHKDIKSGKITVQGDRGKPQIDTSELIRVYGELQQGDTAEAVTEDSSLQAAQELATVQITALQRENQLLREQLQKAEAREAQHMETISRQTLILAAPKSEPVPEVQPPKRWWQR